MSDGACIRLSKRWDPHVNHVLYVLWCKPGMVKPALNCYPVLRGKLVASDSGVLTAKALAGAERKLSCIENQASEVTPRGTGNTVAGCTPPSRSPGEGPTLTVWSPQGAA